MPPSSAVILAPPVIVAASTLCPGTTVTYTDLTQVPEEIPKVSPLTVDEPGEPSVTIHIEDSEEETAFLDLPMTNVAASPSATSSFEAEDPSPVLPYSSEDDRPLTSLLPPNIHLKWPDARTLVSSPSSETDPAISLISLGNPKPFSVDLPSSPLDLLVEALSDIPPTPIPESIASHMVPSVPAVSDSSDPWASFCQTVESVCVQTSLYVVFVLL